MRQDCQEALRLTAPQRRLLVAMYLKHPTRLHDVKEFKSNVNVMIRLVLLGLAENSKVFHSGLWKGKLTARGRRIAKVWCASSCTAAKEKDEAWLRERGLWL